MKLLTPDQLAHEPAVNTDRGRAAAWLRACASRPGMPPCIRNVHTTLLGLDTGAHLLPVSINDGDEPADNSYVVSPLTAYTGYAAFEIDQLDRPRWQTWPLQRLVTLIGRWLAAARINRLVQVNNWLLSTNVYPPGWQGEDLAAITGLLQARWPDHAIGWRSLNHVSNAGLIDRLLALGYLAVPSRQVYLFDGRAGAAAPFLRRHNTRLDAGRWRQSGYRAVPAEALAERDFERLEQLYNQLYLDKYSPLNPQYTADWLRAGHRDGWLRLRALVSREGRIDGVAGWFGTTGLMTAPVIGYDTALPQRTGLYRLLTRLCLQEAADRREWLNFSAGAAGFKRLRGGQPVIEYSLVAVHHLPRPRQRAWRLLAAVLQRVGVPVMQRWQL